MRPHDFCIVDSTVRHYHQGRRTWEPMQPGERVPLYTTFAESDYFELELGPGGTWYVVRRSIDGRLKFKKLLDPSGVTTVAPERPKWDNRRHGELRNQFEAMGVTANVIRKFGDRFVLYEDNFTVTDGQHVELDPREIILPQRILSDVRKCQWCVDEVSLDGVPLAHQSMKTAPSGAVIKAKILLEKPSYVIERDLAGNVMIVFVWDRANMGHISDRLNRLRPLENGRWTKFVGGFLAISEEPVLQRLS